MRDEFVERFMSVVGSSKVQRKGNRWVGTCPLATWTHSGGTDNSPSFAVWKSKSGWVKYNCFGCGHSGTARGLIWIQMGLSGRVNYEAMELVYDPWGEFGEDEKMSELSYRIGGDRLGKAIAPSGAPVGVSESFQHDGSPALGGKTEALWKDMEPGGTVPSIVPPTEEEITRLSSGPYPDYARKRDISEETYRRWELGDDQKNRRLMFPCRGEMGELVGMTGRLYWEEAHCFRCGEMIIDEAKTERKGKVVLMAKCAGCRQSYVKYKHMPGRWRSTSVYGIHLFTDGYPVVLMEGSTDVIRLADLGVASPGCIFGSSPSLGQMQSIARKTGIVYAMGDGDEAGRQMSEHVRMMGSQIGLEVIKVELDEGDDPGMLRQEQVNDLLPQSAFL